MSLPPRSADKASTAMKKPSASRELRLSLFLIRKDLPDTKSSGTCGPIFRGQFPGGDLAATGHAMLPRSLVGTSIRFRRRLTAAVAAAWLIPATAASAEEHAIDTVRSTITLHVAKSGLFRAFAD